MVEISAINLRSSFGLRYYTASECIRTVSNFVNDLFLIRALCKKFNFYFSGVFCWYWKNVHFGRKTEHYFSILWSVETFLIFYISQVFRQPVNQPVYSMSITKNHTICFTYGERKICSNIKKSQNIIAMIVCKIFFCFLGLY